MSFFVEYEPNDKKELEKNSFYNKYNLSIRKVKLEDCKHIAQISYERDGDEKGDYNKSFQSFEKKIKLVLDQDKRNQRELFVATIIEDNDEEIIIGFSYIEYCDFTDRVKFKDITASSGFYLLGLIVALKYRRLGIAEKLTIKRISWVKENLPSEKKVYYFTNIRNQTSTAFHKILGFKEIGKQLEFPKRNPLRTIYYEIVI